MPRPTVFTLETLQKLEYAFSIGCSDEEACLYADISPASLYNFQAKNHEFLERKKLLQHKPILKARIELVEGLTGNPMLALKYLERRKKEEFSPTFIQKIEMDSKDSSYLENDPIIQTLKNEYMSKCDSRLKEIKLKG